MRARGRKLSVVHQGDHGNITAVGTIPTAKVPGASRVLNARIRPGSWFMTWVSVYALLVMTSYVTMTFHTIITITCEHQRLPFRGDTMVRPKSLKNSNQCQERPVTVDALLTHSGHFLERMLY